MIYKLAGLLRSSPIEGRTLSNWLRDDVIKGIAVHLIEHGVTLATDNDADDEWVSVIECLPTESGEYLCAVIEPVSGGISIRRRYMLMYDAYEKLWVCENMIVTHWTLAPDLPKS